MQTKLKPTTRGFTLLELLIVLGIIVVLAVVVIVVINPAEMLRKSRDVQRLSDLATLKKALSLYVTTVNSPDLDASVASFCLAPANTSAKIAYSYAGTLSGCTANVDEGSDRTAGTTFSTTNYCQSVTAIPVTTDNFTTQYSTSSNPTPTGNWSYGYKNTSPTTGTFTLNAHHATYNCGGATLDQWVPTSGIGDPVVQKNISGTTASCVGLTIPAGTMAIYPGPIAGREYGVIRWTAPSTGTYVIAGRFYDIGTQTVDVHVVHNTTSLFSGVVNTTTNTNTPFSVERTITAGDTIDFAVGDGDNTNTDDTTGIEGTISTTAIANTSIDGTGWVPVNLSSVPGGSSLSALPIDPTNSIADTSAPASTDFTYRYTCQQSAEGGKPSRVFELNAQLESAAFTQSDDKRVTDGGDNDNYYEVGTSLRLLGTGTNF